MYSAIDENGVPRPIHVDMDGLVLLSPESIEAIAQKVIEKLTGKGKAGIS